MPEAGLPPSFLGALQALTDWLDGERVPYVTIGGVAVSLLAQPRATQDIDVVIWLPEEDWAQFLRAGAAYGFAPRVGDALEFARRARVLLLRHQPSGVSGDVSCGALPFEREMIERAALLELGRLKLRVPTPEDLIITKLVAQRAKDIADIESLMSVCAELDVARVKRWAREFAAALEMPEMIATLDGLLRRHLPGGG
ncbi:MAG TPA: nucleotidyl transferase AbiEii/AbiGii toxin family protein [Pyrinomonadaceae bacterium]|jgi:hypothetical protein